MPETQKTHQVSDGKLEGYFSQFRQHVVGVDQTFTGPLGPQKILYADWVASGRLYGPIEDRLRKEIGPYVANTHTETSFTGKVMTQAYHKAREIIKQHVNAGPDDILIPVGSGMTDAILKLQRILGLKLPEQHSRHFRFKKSKRPVVFITHMEHHSNHTSWLETLAEVVQINPDNQGMPDLSHFAELLRKYRRRPLKIASVTAGSNVTGIITPYHQIARMIHGHNGFCFVDFACSAPYVDIDMHPAEEAEQLDAIFMSPHKFLGGPGTPGILLFNSRLYGNQIPDQPGGGTVAWTNPWGQHRYFKDIETREDGGTPAFLQTIKAAMAMQLKEQMGTAKIAAREHELINYVMEELQGVKGLRILAANHRDRLGVISFYIDELHYNLCVSLLNDHFGIQVRGGCSCAGTYGHYLLKVGPDFSREITDRIDHGDLSTKPGWVRLSLHPVMTDEEVVYICRAIKDIAQNWRLYERDYERPLTSNEFFHRQSQTQDLPLVESWFKNYDTKSDLSRQRRNHPTA